jgi:hypothetical protein
MKMHKIIKRDSHIKEDDIEDDVSVDLDSLLRRNQSRKIKRKDRLMRSKDKAKDTFIRRDSFKFEYVETKFRQRADRTDQNDVDEKDLISE